VTILPHRGRLLGLKIHAHPALWNPDETTAAWNLGGERLWIGPEADWFWQRLGTPDFAHYKVPSALDPDVWIVEENREGYARATLEATLRSAHRGAFVSIRVERSMQLLAPLGMHSRNPGLGLLTTTTAEILDGTPGQPLDLWSIIQVPHGGKMVVPTVGTPTPRDYFDPCPSAEMERANGVLLLQIGGPSMFKIGLPPDQSTGRMAYARAVDGGMLVVERSFPVHPSLRYCDAPLSALETQGDAAQFFNDGGNFGNFGEMEHRSPAIVCGSGPQRITESTVTTASLMGADDFTRWEALYLQNLEY
jgi:hypothetical protein